MMLYNTHNFIVVEWWVDNVLFEKRHFDQGLTFLCTLPPGHGLLLSVQPSEDCVVTVFEHVKAT